MRYPKTQNERKQTGAVEHAHMYEEGIKFIPIRSKRNAKNLPSDWDDLLRHREKNWKTYRKNQYKNKLARREF